MSLVLLQGDGERKSRARSDEEKKHHTRPKWYASAIGVLVRCVNDIFILSVS